jgi:hypothetical protein
MTHKDDVAWALGHANTAALAVRIIKLEPVSHPFQYTLGTVGAALVALVTNAAGETATGFGRAIESHMNLVKR